MPVSITCCTSRHVHTLHQTMPDPNAGTISTFDVDLCSEYALSMLADARLTASDPSVACHPNHTFPLHDHKSEGADYLLRPNPHHTEARGDAYSCTVIVIVTSMHLLSHSTAPQLPSTPAALSTGLPTSSRTSTHC